MLLTAQEWRERAHAGDVISVLVNDVDVTPVGTLAAADDTQGWATLLERNAEGHLFVRHRADCPNAHGWLHADTTSLVLPCTANCGVATTLVVGHVRFVYQRDVLQRLLDRAEQQTRAFDSGAPVLDPYEHEVHRFHDDGGPARTELD